MDKELAKFINHEVNAVKVEVIISREKTNNGTEYIQISPKIGNDYKQMYSFWHNPNKKVRGPDDKPKHTGGKKPYVIVMYQEVMKLKEKGVKNARELVSYLMCIGDNIEWNTCKLINKRTKKPLKRTDVEKLFDCGKNKFDKLMAQMKKYDLLYKTNEGYFVSTKYIKKGKTERKES